MEADPLTFLQEQERKHGTFHVEFRLADTPGSDWTRAEFEDALDRWFGGPTWRTGGYQLELIGTDWSGGMFCTWTYPALKNRSPPVVYLGSEGEGLATVANDTLCFVELLVTGRVWVGYGDGGFEDDDQPPTHREFARDAVALFGFPGRKAEEIQREAASAHPDFKRWADAAVSG